MAELFGATKQNISYHLQNIYKEIELQREATVKEFLTVQAIDSAKSEYRKFRVIQDRAFLSDFDKELKK